MKPSLFICLSLLLTPIPSPVVGEELKQAVFVVPPTFPYIGQPVPTLRKARSPRQILESVADIKFGAGSSAYYNPDTSQLFVTLNSEQVPRVKEFIDGWAQDPQRQIYFTFREVRFTGDVPGLGNWWRDFIWSSETGASHSVSNQSPKDENQLLAKLSNPPRPVQAARPARVLGIPAVLTDPQMHLLLRSLEAIEEIRLSDRPSIMCRPGRSGYVEAGEFRIGVSAELRPDLVTSELKVYLPPVGGGFTEIPGELPVPVSMTVRNGQTLVITETNEDGTCRLVFIKNAVCDPAGMKVVDWEDLRLSEDDRIRLVEECLTSAYQMEKEKNHEGATASYETALSNSAAGGLPEKIFELSEQKRAQAQLLAEGQSDRIFRSLLEAGTLPVTGK